MIVGIGGSATNDGGAGLGQALGFRLLDPRAANSSPGGGNLAGSRGSMPPGAARARRHRNRRRLRRGQSALRAPRGVGRVRPAERGVARDGRRARPQPGHFAEIVERDLGVAIKDLPGSGAAGGLGGGLWPSPRGNSSPGSSWSSSAVKLPTGSRMPTCA